MENARVVNGSSFNGIVASPMPGAYTMSKPVLDQAIARSKQKR